jgi:hypothetical protein
MTGIREPYGGAVWFERRLALLRRRVLDPLHAAEQASHLHLRPPKEDCPPEFSAIIWLFLRRSLAVYTMASDSGDDPLHARPKLLSCQRFPAQSSLL